MNLRKRELISRLLWLGVIAYSAYALTIDSRVSFSHISRFLRHQGVAEEIRQEAPHHRDNTETKRRIPAGSRVQFSYPKLSIKREDARYHLYPSKITDDWQYYADVKNTNRHVFPPSWESTPLPLGGRIYAVPGNSFIQKIGEESRAPQLMAVIVFLWTVLFKGLTGYEFLRCMEIQPLEWGRAGYITLSYLIGEFLLSCAVWGYLLLGGNLACERILLLWAAVLVILFLIARRHKPVLFKFERTLDVPGRFRMLSILAGSAVFVLFAGIALKPVVDWDAMSFWMMKAKVFYDQQALDLSYTHNNHYPLLWPVSMASQFVLLGEYNDQMAPWASGLFFLAFIILTTSVLKTYKFKSGGLGLIVLLFLAAFFYPEVMNTAKAENPFLAYTAGAVAALVFWFHSPRKGPQAWLVVLMAAALTMTKFEGFVTSAFLGLSLMILNAFRYRDFKTLWFSLCLIFLVPLLELLWIFWCRMNGYLTPISHLKAGLSFPKALLILTVSLVEIIKSPLFIIILLAVLILLLKKEKLPWREEEKCLLYFSLLLFSFSLFFAYIGLTSDQIIKGVPEAVIRLSVHASPALIVLWCSRMFRQQV